MRRVWRTHERYVTTVWMKKWYWLQPKQLFRYRLYPVKKYYGAIYGIDSGKSAIYIATTGPTEYIWRDIAEFQLIRVSPKGYFVYSGYRKRFNQRVTLTVMWEQHKRNHLVNS